VKPPRKPDLIERVHRALPNTRLHTRLLLSFVGIVLLVGGLSALLGVELIRRTVPRVQDVLAVDLGAARELYNQNVSRLADVGRRLAQKRVVQEGLQDGDEGALNAALQAVRQGEDLDFLILTDVRGEVRYPAEAKGSLIAAPGLARIVGQALRQRKEVTATTVLSQASLAGQSPELAVRAHVDVVSTPHAIPETQDGAEGLVAAAAIPVFSDDGRLAGALATGQLLNGRNAIVDRIRNGLYREETYEQRSVAVVSIFLGGKRIATTAITPSGERALGTLISGDVYNRVIRDGKRWIRPGYIVDDRYLTAYEPIRDMQGKVVGALGLGLLERKFQAVENSALTSLLLLTGAAILLAIFVSYLLSRSILSPLDALIDAAKKIAGGGPMKEIHLDRAPPEIDALGDSFNKMTAAIRARDQKLEKQTHEKLMRSDRLAMVGQLAAGVAHEINNPLGSILLFCRLVMQQVPAEGRVRENLDRIEKETKRCNTIVRSLLDFARERRPMVESLDANRVIDSTLQLFEGQFLIQNVELVRDYQEDLPPLQADQSQLQQVFMNLIINAVDAMNGKGRLIFRTRASQPPGFVEISITDTGCGISPENLERIFDPFFTTKTVGHGTGLGLSVSYGIVQSHGGDITVVSAPGAGATFTVSLPVAQRPH